MEEAAVEEGVVDMMIVEIEEDMTIVDKEVEVLVAVEGQ